MLVTLLMLYTLYCWWAFRPLPSSAVHVKQTLFTRAHTLDEWTARAILHMSWWTGQHVLFSLTKLDPKMIQEVLITFEFCIRVDPLLLKEEMLSLTEQDEVKAWLYFPALVSVEAHEVFEQDHQRLNWACWQLKTSCPPTPRHHTWYCSHSRLHWEGAATQCEKALLQSLGKWSVLGLHHRCRCSSPDQR